MKTYLNKIMAFIKDEEGAAAIEYALLLVMVALAIIGVAATLGPKIASVFTSMDNAMAPWPLNNCPCVFGGRGRSLRASAPALPGEPILPDGETAAKSLSKQVSEAESWSHP